jgi:3',5'-cyclic AMP phosphodiesterase CpdA
MATDTWICFSVETETLVREAVALINAAQESWLLHIDSRVPEGDALSLPHEPHALASEVGEATHRRPLIYVTHEPFTDKWFSHEFQNISAISSYGFNRLDTGFPLVAYLIYQIAQSLLTFAVKKSEWDLLYLCHDPALSCLFDLCSYKPDIRLGMAAGGLCPKCHDTLREMGASETHMQDLTRILNVVARSGTYSGDETRPQDWKPDMLSILHISDLHFGRAFRFQSKMIRSGPPPVFEPFGSLAKLGDLLALDLERISADPQLPPNIRSLASRVDVVVISGDIANSGGRDRALPLRDGGPTDEYEQAAEFVATLVGAINGLRQKESLLPLDATERVLVVPGNHDVNWDEPPDSPDRFLGYAKFWRRVTGSRAYFDCPPNEIMVRTLIEVDGTALAIVGFNSCTVTAEPIQLREIGLVEDAQLSFCERFLQGLSQEPDRKVAIFHHHPIYIPALAAGIENYDAMLQAGKLLSYLQHRQFDLILHGHKHYPMAWVHNMIPYEAPAHGSWSEPVIVSSGSLSADNEHLPSSVPNTYQLIGLRKKKDPLRPVCSVIRRKFRRGDTLYGVRFEPDGVFHLGHDSLSPMEREKRLERLQELASPVGHGSPLHRERAMRYEESAGWMLVHRYRASDAPDQEYDISVYLIEKKWKNRRKAYDKKEIDYVRYAVGEMWFGSPFTVSDPENGFELKLSAYGPFLCIAEVHFTDGSICRLERFIDFEMADA